MNVDQIRRYLASLENRIREFPTAVQAFIYLIGFILVLAGLFPGTDFGAFKIPPLHRYARLGVGIVGAAHAAGFVLMFLKERISRPTIALAIAIGIILCVSVVWSSFSRPTGERSKPVNRTEWLFVSRIHGALMSSSDANNPDEFKHLRRDLKYYLDPQRAADEFREKLAEDASMPLQDYANRGFESPFVFVTGPRQRGVIRFDWLSHDLQPKDVSGMRLVVGIIAYRDTSIHSTMVTMCFRVRCDIGIVAEQAAVFIYPLDRVSWDIVNRLVEEHR